MTPRELKERTERFARDIVGFCAPLFDVPPARDIADQLLRSGTAVNANYGSTQCGRTNDEFVAKLGQVWDDSNESTGWLELLRDTELIKTTPELIRLAKESLELTKIFASSFRTAKENQERRKAAEKLKREVARRPKRRP